MAVAQAGEGEGGRRAGQGTQAHERRATRSRPPRQCWQSPRAAAALGEPAGDPPREPGPSIDHRRIELDEAGAGADAFPRVVGPGDPADADQRELAPARARKSRSALQRQRLQRRARQAALLARMTRPQRRPRRVVLATISASTPWSMRDADDLVRLALAEIGRDFEEDRRAVLRRASFDRRRAAPSARPRPATGGGPACWAS